MTGLACAYLPAEVRQQRCAADAEHIAAGPLRDATAVLS